MSTLDKMNRIITAKENDEGPLVVALRKCGWVANRTTGGSLQNMRLGDVTAAHPDRLGKFYSFEVQVSPGHTRMSWTKKKLTNFMGAGDPDDAYCILGCKDEDIEDRILVLVQNAQLAAYLPLLPQGVFLNGDGDRAYYIIPPTALASDLEFCITGRTMDEIIVKWDKRIRNL